MIFIRLIRNTFIFLTTVFIVSYASGNPSFSPSIIEMVDEHSSISKEEMIRYAEKQGIDKNSLFNWENRWVLYLDENSLGEIKSGLENQFRGLKIKTFAKPFYHFSREKNCSKASTEKWSHTIMTSNLVADTQLQDEYMEYHRLQFEEWPEVSNGFCNAFFQQVLLFRNGRQLMLVISIPEGENLDVLNLKTKENNPRVDKWNSIMARYQEGIESTPEDVVWIEFEQVNQ